MSLPTAVPTSKIVKKRKMNAESIDYSTLSKSELIDELIKVKSHLNQVKILMEKQANRSETGKNKDESKELEGRRGFDFNKFNKRHVLIKIAYLGWDFHVG